MGGAHLNIDLHREKHEPDDDNRYSPQDFRIGLHRLHESFCCCPKAEQRDGTIDALYKGTSDGVWLQHRIYRGHVHFNDSKGVPRVLRAGVEPCLKLKNTIVPLPRKLKTDLQLNNAADMLGISKSKSARANLNGKELLDKLKVRPMPPASAYYTFRRRLHPLQRGCDWFADWYELAENPTLRFREVHCPGDIASALHYSGRESLREIERGG